MGGGLAYERIVLEWTLNIQGFWSLSTFLGTSKTLYSKFCLQLKKVCIHDSFYDINFQNRLSSNIFPQDAFCWEMPLKFFTDGEWKNKWFLNAFFRKIKLPWKKNKNTYSAAKLWKSNLFLTDFLQKIKF